MAALPNAGTYHGMFAHVHSQGKGYFAHGGAWYELVNKELNGTVGVGTEVYNIGVTSISTLNVLGVSTFAGNVDINADIDVDGHTNLDNVSVAGVTTFAGIIEGIAGENKIPSLYSDIPSLPNAGTYHGMFAHVHATGRGYFSHAGGWYELVNKESNGTVGTGTETYNIGSLTATGIDLNGDIDVDGHTNLDNVSVVGVSTFTGNIDLLRKRKANQFIFLNNRLIKDKNVEKAIISPFLSSIQRNEYPFYVINISVPYDYVDVNVHPNKNEVRFKNKDHIYHIIKRAISESIKDIYSVMPSFYKQSEYSHTENINLNFRKELINEVPDNIQDHFANYDKIEAKSSEILDKNTDTENDSPLDYDYEIFDVWQIHNKYLLTEITP